MAGKKYILISFKLKMVHRFIDRQHNITLGVDFSKNHHEDVLLCVQNWVNRF